MKKKNGDCGTYMHGWMCVDVYVEMIKFKPWLDVDTIADELNEYGGFISIMVSDERQNIEDVVEAIANAESINPHAMWLHPFFVGFETMERGWIVVVVDKVYHDNNFGNNTITAYVYEGDTKLIAD